MMRGMITRVDRIEREQGIRGPGCIWCRDNESPETARQRYLEQWPEDEGKDIAVLRWGPPPPDEIR